MATLHPSRLPSWVIAFLIVGPTGIGAILGWGESPASPVGPLIGGAIGVGVGLLLVFFGVQAPPDDEDDVQR